MVTPIQQLGDITPISGKKTEDAAQAQLGQGSMFSSIFQAAIQNVKDTDAEVVKAQYLLSTGQLDNPASAMIAFSKEQVAVNLLIQLRNRAMDAYSELTRLNI